MYTPTLDKSDIEQADSHPERKYLDEFALHAVEHSDEQADAVRGFDGVVLVPVVEHNGRQPACSQASGHEGDERQTEAPAESPAGARAGDASERQRDPRQQEVELSLHG